MMAVFNYLGPGKASIYLTEILVFQTKAASSREECLSHYATKISFDSSLTVSNHITLVININIFCNINIIFIFIKVTVMGTFYNFLVIIVYLHD